MGITYHYANLTKREWFVADALGGNPKAYGVGHSLAARALSLLLLDGNPRAASPPVGAGRWSRDSIALIGDTDEDWLRYLEEFADIEADVILLVMYARDGFEDIASAAENEDGLFMQLCHMVVTRQALGLEPHMKQKFGTNFRQRYKDYCLKNPRFKPKDVAFPAGA